MPSAHLVDRGVVRVSGEDAKTFLDNLITCDLDKVTPETARLGALLSPQGKILFDFILFEAPAEMEGGYYLDVLKVHAAELAKRLAFYKLRAKVIVEDLSGKLAVVAGWDSPDSLRGIRLGLGRPASTGTRVAGDRRRRGSGRIRNRPA